MTYDNYSDDQLIQMIYESSEEAKDQIFEKYKYIIDIEIKKYSKMANILGYDYNDLYQDALVGFADAISSYRNDKKASLPTFITLCVDRKLQVSIKKAGRIKNRILRDSLSLEYVYKDSSPLKDLISDESQNDPLENIVKEEKTHELIEKINNELSTAENEVYSLMIGGLDYKEIAILLDKTPKQIDNTMQRIKNKIKKIIKEQEQ